MNTLFGRLAVCTLVLGATAQAHAADVNVGPGRALKTLAAGVNAAKSGDRVLLDAGTYTNDTAIVSVPLTIEGAGAGAVLHENILLANHKGILITDAATIVRNITFDGAAVSDDDGNNGAGIRGEAGDLTVDNCTFTNNQDGILVNAIPGATVSITASNFNGNGAGDGRTHAMYINEVASLTVVNSTFNGTKIGHDIKSRALITNVSNSNLDDGVTGTTSYAVDLPNGGVAVLNNITVNQGKNSDNGAMIAYGAEGSLKAVNSLVVSNSTFTDQLRTASSVAVYNYTNVPVTLSNDNIAQVQMSLRGPGQVLNSTQAVSVRTASIFSSAQTSGLSFLRFYNNGPASGTVTVSLYDSSSGNLVSTWVSPSIPPGASPQYAVATIEAAATQGFTVPAYYSLALHADINGAFQHILYRPADGTLTDLSSCDGKASTAAQSINNVHSSVVLAGFPSTVVVYNTGAAVSHPLLGIYDARNGTRLGGYIGADIAPMGQVMLNVPAIEAALHLTPDAGMLHYNVAIENNFTGMLQHLVNNQRVGVLTDMTAACTLNY